MTTSCRYRSLAGALLLLLAPAAGAQVIQSWDRGGGVITNMGENLIDDDTYAAAGIFMDWSDQLADMERSAVATDREISDRITTGGYATSERLFRSRTGAEYNLPEIISDDGTDLYMLTKEGITIYMALDAPVYFQEISDETVRLVRYYAYRKKSYTRSMFRRYAGWEQYLKEYFTSQGVPAELTELCMVESGCTYTALSSAGARGMWQIMPATGRQYGLSVSDTKDDRNDPVLSTIAAAKILKANYRLVGEWTLAAASYNCGAGRIQKYSSRGMQWDDIRPSLPAETQKYIPALLALHYVWTYRDRLGLSI